MLVPSSWIAPALLGLPLALSAAIATQSQPVELGRVTWNRELGSALARAGELGQPVFALFQEIPGCATCRNFGSGPLSHPLLVEAIEDLFVPLAVYNNRPGDDARVLKRYGEPSWNNPVVRFLSADGSDLLERRDRVWSTAPLAARACAALTSAGGEAPFWLRSLAQEGGPGTLETATFSMHCFWQGEAELGALDGVRETRAGWRGGREVVELRYDPQRLASRTLEARARQLGYRPETRADETGAHERDAKDSDRKFYLRRSKARFLPLTSAQRTKVNSALARGTDPGAWLSPRQERLLDRIERADDSVFSGLDPFVASDKLAAYERELRLRLGG